MAQLADTLTTRDAVRRATADDIVGRAQIAAVAIEGGELDGVEVVSLGTLRTVVMESLGVKLPPPSDRFAEVTTPATITVSTICPECSLATELVVKLAPQLTVTNDGAEINVKAKVKARVHVLGQLSLAEDDDNEQLGMDDVVIEDLRLRILGAVYDLEVELDEATQRGEPEGAVVTLDAIAARLELESESDRGDLEESLHSYSQLQPSLVDVVSAVGAPVTYALTEAGTTLVDDGRDNTSDEPGDDADEPAADA